MAGCEITLDIAAIERETDSYLNSVSGRAERKKAIDEMVEFGVMTDMEKAADELVNIVGAAAFRNLAVSANSVVDLFFNMEHSRPQKAEDGSYEISFYFTGDMHRESLKPKMYPAGVDNIVKLIIKGYKRKKGRNKIWGMWHGHRTHALMSRHKMSFFADAVEEFNHYYGKTYGVVATLESDYI